MTGQTDEAVARTDFWMKVAGVTFGLWAMAIPLAAMWLRDAIHESAIAHATLAREFRDHLLANSTALALIQERQNVLLLRLQRLDELRDEKRKP